METSWIEDHSRLESIAKKIDKSIILTTKDSWFWIALSWILFIVTIGSIKRKTFLEEFATTICMVQAYPRNWSISSVELTISHESQHVLQFRWFGFGIHPIVGFPFMMIFYIFFPFPIGLAYFRYRLELDADMASWKYLLTIDISSDQIRDHAKLRAGSISGSSYGWAWPKPWVMNQFMIAAEEVITYHKLNLVNTSK